MAFRFRTARESDEAALTAVIDSVAASLPLIEAHLNEDMARRPRGYSRSGRMTTDPDQILVSSDVCFRMTPGSPISLTMPHWRRRSPDGRSCCQGLPRPMRRRQR